MDLRPLGKTVKEGYLRQKQLEQAEYDRLQVNVVIDPKQAEREIDKAMKYIVKKINGK